MTSARGLRAAGSFTLASLLACLAMLAWAALEYPGGSWADAQAEGFAWFVNYWCDLMRTEAWNGAPNGTSAALSRIGFVALGASTFAFWRVAASLMTSPRLARWGVASGAAASVCIVLVAVLPHDLLPRWHAIVTLAAGGLGFVATALVMLGSVRAGPLASWRHAWGAALVLAAAANIAIYADILLRDDGDSATLPVVQKAGTLFMALWMCATVFEARAARAVEAT